MFNHIATAAHVMLAATTVSLIGVLSFQVKDLHQEVGAAIEAVAIIEDAARNIEADMEILRNIADREECYANRGEWLDEYGCHLEEVQ